MGEQSSGSWSSSMNPVITGRTYVPWVNASKNASIYETHYTADTTLADNPVWRSSADKSLLNTKHLPPESCQFQLAPFALL